MKANHKIGQVTYILKYSKLNAEKRSIQLYVSFLYSKYIEQ